MIDHLTAELSTQGFEASRVDQANRSDYLNLYR